MATVTQIQKGFVRFVDTHVSGAFSGWQKALVIGAATLLAGNLPTIVETYCQHPMVAALGIYKPESGTVDVDAVYDAIVPHMGADKIPITIPKIATIKLGKEELDALKRYIQEA